MNILATSGGFRPDRRTWLTAGPIIELAFELAGAPERPRFCYLGTALGDDPPCRRRLQARSPAATSWSATSACSRCRRSRTSARTCSPRTSSGSAAAASPTCSRSGGCTAGRDLPGGVGGRRRARRGVGRLAVLARRRHDRLLRPRPAPGHQRAGAAALRPTACTTTPRSSAARSTSGWSPTARCRPGTPPTTASGCVYRGTELVEAVADRPGRRRLPGGARARRHGGRDAARAAAAALSLG